MEDDEYLDMPDLQNVSNSESDSDDDTNKVESNGWFTDIDDNDTSSWNSKKLSGIDWSKSSSFINVDLDSEAAEDDELIAKLDNHNINTPQAEIYNSGCSKHITPYQDTLENFVNISPRSLCAANKSNIKAEGMGEMTIDVPNSADILQLKLTEVGYTLMSVGCLDKKGFEITFSGGKCTIHGPDGNHIDDILKLKGLYRVIHDQPEYVNSAEEELTLDQFHHRMGHISLGVAHNLVEKGFVTSVCLESTPAGEFYFCKCCVYAKATQKSVPKICDGKHTTSFGDEVHSDLWGLADVHPAALAMYF